SPSSRSAWPGRAWPAPPATRSPPWSPSTAPTGAVRLARDAQGNLFGTTNGGGSSNAGTVVAGARARVAGAGRPGAGRPDRLVVTAAALLPRPSGPPPPTRIGPLTPALQGWGSLMLQETHRDVGEVGRVASRGGVAADAGQHVGGEELTLLEHTLHVQLE